MSLIYIVNRTYHILRRTGVETTSQSRGEGGGYTEKESERGREDQRETQGNVCPHMLVHTCIYMYECECMSHVYRSCVYMCDVYMCV